MKTLLESIDKILAESVSNLGFPDWVVERIKRLIPNHRKNRHYFGKYFKHSNAVVQERLLLGNAFKNVMSLKERAKVLKKYGVRDIEVKPSDEYTVRETKELDRALSRQIVRDIETIDDFLTLRKKISKAIDNKRKIQRASDTIDDQIDVNLDVFINTSEELILWMNNDEYAYRELKSTRRFRDALNLAKEMDVQVQVDQSRVFLEMPNNYYWYRVTEEECRIEGDRMNHCGRKTRSRSKMYSLRDPDNDPHVTIEYDASDNEVVQLRGNSNQIPKETYWDAIKAFMRETEAKVIDTYTDKSRAREFFEYITQDGGSYSTHRSQSIQGLEWRAHQLLDNILQDRDGLEYDLTGRVEVVTDGLEPDLHTDIQLDIWWEALEDDDERSVKRALTRSHDLTQDLKSELREMVEVVFSENFRGVNLWDINMDGVIVRADDDPFITIAGLTFEHDIADAVMDDIADFMSGVENSLRPDSIRQLLDGIAEYVAMNS